MVAVKDPIQQVTDHFWAIMRARPERCLMTAQQAAMSGKRRRYPAITINHLGVPNDPDGPAEEDFQPRTIEFPPGHQGELAREIMGMLEPLKLLNPVSPRFGLGDGPRTLAPSFGIRTSADERGSSDVHKSLESVLSEPRPDPAASGLMPQIGEKIRIIKDNVPDDFKIGLPDLQGPFNLAHLIVGEEAFTAPYVEPKKFRQLMDMITDFWIETRQALVDWIGKEYLYPWYYDGRMICECAVNMISSKMYEEFILPYDQRIASALGTVAIHPCSGPHVFHATLDNLPVVYTEAGFVDQSHAGAISVEEALRAIGDHPIVLSIAQELPAGEEESFIRKDLDRYLNNPRLMFLYTGMHWRRKDRPLIRDLHTRLDQYWEERIYPRAIQTVSN